MVYRNGTSAAQETLPESSRDVDDDFLSAALNPASVAVIGASNNTNKIGGRTVHYLSRFGFRGRIYPINPSHAEVQGFRAYPTIAALPETPDLAVVAAPGPHVLAAVDECATHGVRATIVMAAGFGETTDAVAIAAEREMVVRARRAGMRMIGPNSQGLANFGSGAVASFSTMFLEVEPADGPVGIVSQSGMMSVMPYGLLRRRGIGVRHAHATGNDADVGLAELARAVVMDPGIRLLLLYIESIRDPAMLALVAEIARDREIPIVAVKSGRTARGQAAARSHTGALANEDRVVDAFFREHGIWRARDVHEMVAAAEMYLSGWRPHGRRLAVVSNSGASCVMAADAVQDVSLELATLADTTIAKLRAALPSFATTTNPIDITAALLTNSALFGEVLQVIADDDGADLLLVALPVAGSGYDVPAFARAAAQFVATAGKPLVVASPQPSVAAQFANLGIPTFENQTEAVHVLAQVAEHARLTRRPRRSVVERTVPAIPAGRARFLSEVQSLDVLRACGLPVVTHRLCRSVDEALSAFREIGGPVAVKANSSEVPHKSEHGLVLLGVDSEEGVERAFHQLVFGMRGVGIRFEGIIVARMATGRREFVLGAKVDPVFGPVLMVGDGGRYVESLGDIQLLLPPVDIDDVRAALFSLRMAPLLTGVRNEPALDIEPLCEAAVRLGDLIVAAADEIVAIDVNPVCVSAEGDGIVIVDALIERSPARRGALPEAG